MTAQERLAEIKARAQAATEGPWEWEATAPAMSGVHWNMRIKGKPGIRFTVAEYQHGPDNAEFIAASRTDVPALVKALEAVLTQTAAMREVAATGYSDRTTQLILESWADEIETDITEALGEDQRGGQ